MSVGQVANQSFEPNEDIAEVLRVLRANGISWIADEIEERILAGTVERKRQEGKRRGQYDDPRALTDDEQVEVLLRALRNYLVVLPKAWNSAVETLTGVTEGRDLSNASSVEAQAVAAAVTLAPPGTGVASISVVPREAAKLSVQLDGLLRRAWPAGAAEYDDERS